VKGRRVLSMIAPAVAIVLATVLVHAGDLRGGHHAAGRFSGDRYLGAVDPRTQLQFGFALRMRQAALERYAQGVAGPMRAPALSPAEIGRRFGISSAQLARLASQLARDGIAIDESFPQRTELLLSAPAARVEQLLGVRLGLFADARGVVFHKPLATPAVPAALRGAVTAITGLNTKRIDVTAAVPQGGLRGPDLANLYDITGLTARGLDGSGQTVAVFSEDTFQDSDIATFDQTRNISGAPPVQRVQFEGPVQFQSGDGATEVDLDIEVIRELAPKAQILDYEAPCCGAAAFSVGIDRIVKDGRAKLVNFSYGQCELELTPFSELQAADASFAAAAAAGVTVFVSSGDQGAYECQRDDTTNHTLSVPWPSSSPNVVSVGGTYVDVRQDGSRLDEVGWEDVLSHAGGGGGVSTLFPRPGWQAGVPGINNGYTTNPPRRQTPDVAADADGASGYSVYSQGQDAMVGGTSAAAPLWTGSFVLISQLAARSHVRLPFIAPLLYRAAARDPSAFYDVTLGGNRFYSAGPGWDYSTGLGVPDMAALARDVLAEAQGH